MTLTLALALAAALLLLALGLHGWWQTRRARPRKAAEPLPAGCKINKDQDCGFIANQFRRQRLAHICDRRES